MRVQEAAGLELATPCRLDAGERFRQVRVGLGLTQKAAARLLNVDPVTVTRCELDERRPRAGLEPRRLVGASCTPAP